MNFVWNKAMSWIQEVCNDLCEQFSKIAEVFWFSFVDFYPSTKNLEMNKKRMGS